MNNRDLFAELNISEKEYRVIFTFAVEMAWVNL